jgi:hypothetical protein
VRCATVFPVCKSNPSVRSKSPLQFRKLIEIQSHGKVDVSGMPEFTGEMNLVCDGTDDDKVCPERNAMVATRAQICDLARSEFGHHSDRYSRLISSAASCARGSEEYINSE